MKQLKKTIVNFHEVTNDVYRSGLLEARAAPLLKDLGIKTVVNFDDNRKRLTQEKEFLNTFGIHMVSVPWNGFDYPEAEDIEKFLELMRTQALRPMLVHCKAGAERTGLAIACWRIADQGWTAERAFNEMKAHGFRAFWYGHLTKYLYQFARDHGDETAAFDNIFARSKSHFFYTLYRIRKLNPFAGVVD